jgi:hypothetical protein
MALASRVHRGTDRFADKEGITDTELREAVNRLEAGQADADLGGGVYTVRVARSGKGKSGGYRVIVFFKSEERTFYAYGFAKSGMDNINEKQLRNFKLAAKTVFAYSDTEIDGRVKNGLFIEI